MGPHAKIRCPEPALRLVYAGLATPRPSGVWRPAREARIQNNRLWRADMGEYGCIVESFRWWSASRWR